MTRVKLSGEPSDYCLRLRIQSIELCQGTVQHTSTTVARLNVRFDMRLVERDVNWIQLRK